MPTPTQLADDLDRIVHELAHGRPPSVFAIDTLIEAAKLLREMEIRKEWQSHI